MKNKFRKEKRKFILWFSQISSKDVPLVGGKNASLGEMIKTLFKKGINIPDGFALTTRAYWHFLKKNKIDKKLKEIFEEFNPKDIENLRETGKKARALFLNAEFPKDLEKEIIEAYQILGKKYNQNPDVAVRSSGVAEDAPTMSFAGQFETFLNVKGKENLLKAIKKCLASAFNDRVIAYRQEKRISQLKFALSAGIQKMVRSDLASSGVMFTLDTETGFANVVLVNSIWGVGEMIVKGKITPDEFYIFKPTLKQSFKSIILKNLGRKTKKYVYGKDGGLKEVNVSLKDQLRFSLTDEEILTLAKWACLIEEHYKIPQDIEWAKDGKTNQLFIVQSRPETVHAPKEAFLKSKRTSSTRAQAKGGEERTFFDSSSPSLPLRRSLVYEEYQIKTKEKPILIGTAIGNKIGQGQVHIITDVSKISEFKKGEVLVTKMTDPDWVAIFPLAGAIVTDEGGSTCHAAIISRELGIPAIVGTQKATKVFRNGEKITIDCTQGKNGRIFLGRIPYEIKRYDLKNIPDPKTKIMVNIGAPEIAFKTSFLPNDGVGLARMEFILAEKIRVHPLALYHFKKLEDKKIKQKIEELTIEHKDKKEYFIKELAEGIAQIAAAFWPKDVILRLSDLKTNEYRALIGGELFEPEEANPMLGWRGASRYYDEKFKPAFKMECHAIKRVREEFGLKNVKVMVPYCRTPKEGQIVLKLMREYGLERGKDGLEAYVMCEVPSNVILVDRFSKIFDSYSVGSNDLTQLLLGVDRDNAKLAQIFDESNEAVKRAIGEFIKKAHEFGKKVSICGEAPASVSGFVEFLIKCGIDSISVNPDSVIKTILLASKIEKKLKKYGGG